MADSKLRGHPIIRRNGVWLYKDTLWPTASSWQERSCGHCHKTSTPEGHDGCIGKIPGVKNACCGHGEVQEAYIQFDWNGHTLRGMLAIVIMFALADNLEIT